MTDYADLTMEKQSAHREAFRALPTRERNVSGERGLKGVWLVTQVPTV